MHTVKLLLFCCAFFVWGELFSQTTINTDSLRAELERYPREDTVKVRMLFRLSDEYERSDMQKAMEYVDAAIKTSEQLGDDFWRGKSYKQKARYFLIIGDLENAQIYFRKAIDYIAKDNKYPDDLALCIMLLGSAASMGGDFIAGLEHFESALAAFEATGNVKNQVSAIAGIGSSHYSLGNYEKSLEILQKGLRLNETVHDKANFRLLYTNMALVYYAMGNYASGLDYSFKTLAIAESLGDLQAIATEYNNISSVYFDLNDKKEAQKYLSKALDLYRASSDNIGIARTLINLSFIYDDPEKAIEALHKAMQYCKEIDNNLLLAASCQGLALRYLNVGEYQTAYAYVQQGLAMEEDVQDSEVMVKLNNRLVAVL